MPRSKSPDGLSPKQRRFVEEYLIDLNATEAALRAGYSPRNADKLGSRLVGKSRVAEAIQAAQVARSQRVQLTQDAVLEEIALLVHSDVMHYVIDDHGDVGLRDGAPPHAMRAVASLKKKIIHTRAGGTTYETEIKLWSKPEGLRMGGEHLGLFKSTAQELPDVHVHIHSARDRLTSRVAHLARRHAEDATNGH